MKKSSFLFKALIALFAAAFLYSCDSGGSGGGGSSGGVIPIAQAPRA